MSVQQTIARLYSDRCFQEVARAIRYETLAHAVMKKRLAQIAKEFGESETGRAELALLSVSYRNGKPFTVQLKPQLWVQARQLLGPMPSEMATWYDGLPESAKPKAKRTGRKAA